MSKVALIATVAALSLLEKPCGVYRSDSDMSGIPTTIKTIPLVWIRENKTALRTVDRESQVYKEFKENIRVNGVMQTIMVRECEDPETHEKYYQLIDGLHRFTAAKDCGFANLDCKVIIANDMQVLKQQLCMNIQRVETNPIEYTEQLKRMMNSSPAMTVVELAGMINKSPGYVYERMNLLKLSDKVAKLVDEGKITLMKAYALTRLPIDEQIAMVDQAMATEPKVFVAAVNNRLKELRDAKRKGLDAPPAEFQPLERLRKSGDVKEEFKTHAAEKVVLGDSPTPDMLKGFRLGLAWTLHMDPISIAQDKAKAEALSAEAASARKKREDEKVAKANKDAATAAAAIQPATAPKAVEAPKTTKK